MTKPIASHNHSQGRNPFRVGRATTPRPKVAEYSNTIVFPGNPHWISAQHGAQTESNHTHRPYSFQRTRLLDGQMLRRVASAPRPRDHEGDTRERILSSVSAETDRAVSTTPSPRSPF